MQQSFLEKIFKHYDHLIGRYLGRFCKDEMDNLSKAIRTDYPLYERTFLLINTGTKESNGEHWMGVVMNNCTNSSGYLDTFERKFPWLMNVVKKHFNHVHRTKYIVQLTSVSTCGLYSLYFIIRMMDSFSKSSYAMNIDIGEYVRIHYDTKEDNAVLKDKDIVNYLLRKFRTNFSMLLKK